MLIVRPAVMADLDALEQLAVEAGRGMTTLPSQREALAEKIQLSVDSFASSVSKSGGESYLLLLQDLGNDRVAGSCGMIAGVGRTKPFYSFKILNLTHTSQELDRYEPVEVLQMVDEYRGATEIATLYVTPDYRRNRNGRLLSRCRFLFMAESPQRFATKVIAEMRGVQDETGHSVFWDSLGRHFFDMDFSKADYLSSLGNYQFIADLMPKYPVYVRLLPKEAQAVIGVTHEATRPALALLKREGFRFEGCVDIFDAGPTIVCPLEEIRTVKEGETAEVGSIVDALDSESYMIATTRAHDFRATRGSLRTKDDDRILIQSDVAAALSLEVGHRVRYTRF